MQAIEAHLLSSHHQGKEGTIAQARSGALAACTERNEGEPRLNATGQHGEDGEAHHRPAHASSIGAAADLGRGGSGRGEGRGGGWERANESTAPSPWLLFLLRSGDGGRRGQRRRQHAAPRNGTSTRALSLLCRTAVSDQPSASECLRAASLSAPAVSFPFRSFPMPRTLFDSPHQYIGEKKIKFLARLRQFWVRARRLSNGPAGACLAGAAKPARWRSSSVHRRRAPLVTVAASCVPTRWPRLVMRGVRGWVGWRRPCSAAATWGFRIRHVGRHLFAAVTHASFRLFTDRVASTGKKFKFWFTFFD